MRAAGMPANGDAPHIRAKRTTDYTDYTDYERVMNIRAFSFKVSLKLDRS